MPKASRQHCRNTISGLLRFTTDDRTLNWDNSKLNQLAEFQDP